MELYQKGPPFSKAIFEGIQRGIFEAVLSAPHLYQKMYYFSQAVMYTKRMHNTSANLPHELFEDVLKLSQEDCWQAPFFKKKKTTIARSVKCRTYMNNC